MSISERLPMIIVVATLALGASAIGWRFLGPPPKANPVSVNVPALSGAALRGKRAYDTNCASCHGANGAGSDQGPPLVHDIYNPGHHADEAFLRAARSGVPMHHWPFGDMPPQPQVKFEETKDVIQYVRELQRANGIFYKPHQM